MSHRQTAADPWLVKTKWLNRSTATIAEEKEETKDQVMVETREYQSRRSGFEVADKKTPNRSERMRYCVARAWPQPSGKLSLTYYLFDDLDKLVQHVSQTRETQRQYLSILRSDEPHVLYFDKEWKVEWCDPGEAMPDVAEQQQAADHFLNEEWQALFGRPFPFDGFWHYDASRTGTNSVHEYADCRYMELVSANMEQNLNLVNRVRRRVEQAYERTGDSEEQARARRICRFVRVQANGCKEYHHWLDNTVYKTGADKQQLMRMAECTSWKQPGGHTHRLKLGKAPARYYPNGQTPSFHQRIVSSLLPARAWLAAKLFRCPPLPELEPVRPRPHKPKGRDASTTDRRYDEDQPRRPDMVKKLLPLLHEARADSYIAWRDVMFVIHYECDGSEDGLELFVEFSKRCPRAFKGADDCRAHYESVSDTRAKLLRWGTMVQWAKQDSAAATATLMRQEEKRVMREALAVSVTAEIEQQAGMALSEIESPPPVPDVDDDDDSSLRQTIDMAVVESTPPPVSDADGARPCPHTSPPLVHDGVQAFSSTQKARAAAAPSSATNKRAHKSDGNECIQSEEQWATILVPPSSSSTSSPSDQKSIQYTQDDVLWRVVEQSLRQVVRHGIDRLQQLTRKRDQWQLHAKARVQQQASTEEKKDDRRTRQTTVRVHLFPAGWRIVSLHDELFPQAEGEWPSRVARVLFGYPDPRAAPVEFVGNAAAFLDATTDRKRAQLVQRVFGGRLLYVTSEQKWYVFGGAHWIVDPEKDVLAGLVQRYGEYQVQRIQKQVARLQQRMASDWLAPSRRQWSSSADVHRALQFLQDLGQATGARAAVQAWIRIVEQAQNTTRADPARAQDLFDCLDMDPCAKPLLQRVLKDKYESECRRLQKEAQASEASDEPNKPQQQQQQQQLEHLKAEWTKYQANRQSYVKEASKRKRMQQQDAPEEPSALLEQVQAWLPKREHMWCNVSGYSTIVAAMKTLDGLRVDKVRWNATRDRLAAPNGEINLVTGRLEAADPSHHFSFCTPCAYAPELGCEQVLVDQLRLHGTKQKRDRFQDTLGMQATGHPHAKCAWLWFGPGGDNGKTTTIACTKAALGKFVTESSHALFFSLASKFASSGTSSSAATPDLVDLEGRRIVFIDEVPANAHLDEQKYQKLVGFSDVTGRQLYEAMHTFSQRAYFNISLNYHTQYDATYNPLVKKMKMFFFDREAVDAPEPGQKQFQRDTTLKDRAETQAYAQEMLNFIVEGAVRFYQQGLREPLHVHRRSERVHRNMALKTLQSGKHPIVGFVRDFLKYGTQVLPTKPRQGVPLEERTWLTEVHSKALHQSFLTFLTTGLRLSKDERRKWKAHNKFQAEFAQYAETISLAKPKGDDKDTFVFVSTRAHAIQRFVQRHLALALDFEDKGSPDSDSDDTEDAKDDDDDDDDIVIVPVPTGVDSKQDMPRTKRAKTVPTQTAQADQDQAMDRPVKKRHRGEWLENGDMEAFMSQMETAQWLDPKCVAVCNPHVWTTYLGHRSFDIRVDQIMNVREWWDQSSSRCIIWEVGNATPRGMDDKMNVDVSGDPHGHDEDTCTMDQGEDTKGETKRTFQEPTASSNTHWAAVGYNGHDKCFFYVDSLPSDSMRSAVRKLVDALRNALANVLDDDAEVVKNAPLCTLRCRKQADGWSCGYFAMIYPAVITECVRRGWVRCSQWEQALAAVTPSFVNRVVDWLHGIDTATAPSLREAVDQVGMNMHQPTRSCL